MVSVYSQACQQREARVAEVVEAGLLRQPSTLEEVLGGAPGQELRLPGLPLLPGKD